MKNVLFVFSTTQKSGPVNIILNLLSEIDRGEINPVVLTLSALSNDKISALNEFKKLNITVYSLNLNRFKGFLIGSKLILQICKKNKINSIHLIGFRADVLVRHSKFKNYKIVSSIFSNVFDDYKMLYGNIKGSIMAYLHLKSLKGKIKVACSEFVRESLKKYVNNDFIIIPNAISKIKYSIPSENFKRELRIKYNIDCHKKVFIFVGVLIKRKDPLTTIRAFLNSNVCKSNNAILLVLGDGPLGELCKNLCAENSSIIFMGNTSETLPYLQISDYYIASSHSEGMPTSVLEALGCGLIPLLSSIEPHREIIKYMGNWNYLFEKGDWTKLTQLIENVIYEDFNEISIKCRNIIESELNSCIMSKKYQLLY